MESLDAMDFFGGQGGAGPVISTKGTKLKPLPNQASSSAPARGTAQAGPSSGITNGQASGDGKDFKGKGKNVPRGTGMEGTSQTKGKGGRPTSISSSAPASTSAKPGASQKGTHHGDTAKRKDPSGKGKEKAGGHNGTGSEIQEEKGRKVAGKKPAQPFPMDSQSRRPSPTGDHSDDELSQPGEFPSHSQGSEVNGHVPLASTSYPSTSKASASAARAGRTTPDPNATPKVPIRQRLYSKEPLRNLPSNDSPDVLALRARPKNRDEALADLATMSTRWGTKASSSMVLVPESSQSTIGESSISSSRKRAKSGAQSGRNKGTQDPDDNGTPRAGKPPVKTSEPPRRRRSPVDDKGATEFFANLSRRTAEDKEREAKAAARDAEIEYIMSSQEAANNDVQQLEMELEDDEAFGFTEEELAYCAGFLEKTHPCKYCGEPLPKDPSPRLMQLKMELIEVESQLPFGKAVPWEHYDPYCRRHEAETTIIPLGIRAGFPADIDFSTVRARLEQPWIRSRLERLCADPSSSTFYTDTIDVLRELRHTRWQDSEKILAASFPGYYGDIGLSVLMEHFLALRKWRLLAIPGLVKKDPHNFIQTVLVPESAVMLIMVDRGWTGEVETEAEKRTEAMKIRANSWTYGHAAFPETMQEPTSRAEEKGWVVKYHEARGLPIPQRRKRRKVPSNRAKPAEVIEVSSDTGDSQTDTSEYSASEASDVQHVSERGETDNEVTDGENGRSRSTAGSDQVSTPPFAGKSTTRSIPRCKEDEDEEAAGDTTIKMSQASTNYDDGMDAEEMVAALAAAEDAVGEWRGKSRG